MRNKGGNEGKNISFLICKIKRWEKISVSLLWITQFFTFSSWNLRRGEK